MLFLYLVVRLTGTDGTKSAPYLVSGGSLDINRSPSIRHLWDKDRTKYFDSSKAPTKKTNLGD